MARIMCRENNMSEKEILMYLKELFHDRAIISRNSDCFYHTERLIDREIFQYRRELIASYGIFTISEDDLPEPEGQKVVKQRKVYMPDTGSTRFNFVGRILGPNGSTAKCLQQCLGVKIMIRGRGSTRDKKKEESNIGKPYWEHLNDKLHILLTSEDYENRAEARLAKASEYINAFLNDSIHSSAHEDNVKQMQLMELSFNKETKVQDLHQNNTVDYTSPTKYNQLATLTHPGLLNIAYNAFPANNSVYSHHLPCNQYSHTESQQNTRPIPSKSPSTSPTDNTTNNNPSLPCSVGLMSQSSHALPTAPFLMSHAAVTAAALAASPYLASLLPNNPAQLGPQAGPGSNQNAAALAMTQFNYWPHLDHLTAYPFHPHHHSLSHNGQAYYDGQTGLPPHQPHNHHFHHHHHQPLQHQNSHRTSPTVTETESEQSLGQLHVAQTVEETNCCQFDVKSEVRCDVAQKFVPPVQSIRSGLDQEIVTGVELERLTDQKSINKSSQSATGLKRYSSKNGTNDTNTTGGLTGNCGFGETRNRLGHTGRSGGMDKEFTGGLNGKRVSLLMGVTTGKESTTHGSVEEQKKNVAFTGTLTTMNDRNWPKLESTARTSKDTPVSTSDLAGNKQTNMNEMEKHAVD